MTTKLYETDFSQWAVAQADHLRNEEYAELDLPNLIEEIEDMAQRHRDALESDLFVVLHHLLKLYFLKDGDPVRGWRATVLDHRYRIQRLLQKNPSLRSSLPSLIEALYLQAANVAFENMTINEIAAPRGYPAYPLRCPWTPEQILDLTFWPT